MPTSRLDPVLVALALATSLAGLVLFARLGPAWTFWTVDDAGKSLVVANLEHNPGSTSLEYPGRALDPDFRFFPQPIRGSERYATLHDGRIVSQYLAPFPYLALPFAAVFGFIGLGLWPALGAGAVVLLTGLLAAALGGSRRAGRLAAAILLVSSPLLFYGSVFWEHSLTAALAAAAFLALATPRPRPFVAGLLLGATCLLREETGLLLSAVVLVAMILRRRPDAARIAAGGLLGVAARGAFHWATSGSLVGVHGELNQSVPFEHVGDAARDLLVGPGFSGIPDVAVLGALLVLAAARSLPPRAALAPFALGAVALAVVSVRGWLRFPGGEDSALALLKSNSAALFLPWALAAPFLRGPSGGDAAPSRQTPHPAPSGGVPPASENASPAHAAAAWRLLGGASVLFVVFFVLLVPARSITGVHPGPRMLLPVLPLAAAVCATRLSASRLAALFLAPLLLAGALWNLTSLELLHAKRALAGDLAAALAARPERIVVTDLFWLPTEMSSLWDRKTFYLVGTEREMRAFVARATAAGERTILAATEPGQIPAAPVAAVHRDGLPSFSVDLQVLTLKTEAAP
ncbi:MAG: hypothetical protein U0167_09950 [bacterium]